MPYSTSRSACSLVSAMCISPTRRHCDRSATVPNVAARSSITSQCRPSTSNPTAWVAPIDSSPIPYLPARRGPDGDATAGTATGNSGSEYGRRCRRASVSVHVLVSLDTGSSDVSRRMITSTPSSRRGRVSVGSRPSMIASVGSEPGPSPSMNRPRVRWSSSTARSAIMYGLW